MDEKLKPVTACGNNDCNSINSGIDKCIAPIIEALNMCGVETVASCCGHGRRPGNIALRDGRELIIAPDFTTAREIDSYFPDIQGETGTKQALTDENARLREAMGEAAGIMEKVAFNKDHSLLWGEYNELRNKAAKIRKLLTTKGPTDCETPEED